MIPIQLATAVQTDNAVHPLVSLTIMAIVIFALALPAFAGKKDNPENKEAKR